MIKTTRYRCVTRFDLARTIAGRGRYWTTCYRVGELLVDTGCAHTALELANALDGVPLNRIINTHSHEDHFGANGILQSRQDELEILAHPLAIPVLANPRREQPLHLYRRFFWGWPKPSIARPLSDGELIDTGDFRFQVIYTPGHSADHICLYEVNQGWLFSGDLFVGGNDRALRAGYDIWEIIGSLKCIAALPITTLFPGCSRVREQPHEELSAKIEYLEALGEKVLSLHRQGLSVGSIARTLMGPARWIELVTLGNFSRRQLVLSYLGKNRT